MPVVGLFGISNDGLNLAVNLLVVLLVVVYLALIVWTFLDARRRIEDSWLVACATAASFFPFVGAMVYSILRPPEFIEDRKERELEIRASQLRVKQLGEQSCPNCEYPVERNYLRCPNCEARLKDPCPTCQKPIDPRWAMCPYCETPVRSRQAERRPSGRRRARPERPDREPPSREAQRAARASREGRQPRPPSGDAPKRRAKPRAKAPDSDGQAPPAPPRQPKPPADSENTSQRAAARSRSSRAPETSGGEE
jgi:hypothetical protein